MVSLGACRKPSSDRKAQQLVLGVWKHDFGTVEFQQGGKLVATPASGKEQENSVKLEPSYTVNYTVTKDIITITREEKDKDKEAKLKGLDAIFGKGELSIVLDIVKLKKKEAIVRYKGKEYKFTR